MSDTARTEFTADPPLGRVEFGVLGPLRVASGGGELELTSPRSRAFLALLVLNPGRQVSLYAFADAIWGADLPQNPRRAVQLCAVRVRAQLERIGAGDLVVTCPDGYRLDVPPESTDLGRVESLVREADAASGTDAELAAVTAALALWRGEPLADVPADALQREVAPGLREQRLQLVERRIDILLRNGETAGLVSELTTLTARHPLRERLCGLLMRALYRGGRRSEALDVYHRFRRRLREELGTDPGEELRGLHATVLTGEPDTDRDTPRLLLPTPRELPSDLPAFAGRADARSELDGLLATVDTSSGPVVGVVTGTAGVGKTSLAVHWARGVADEFPDGQLFADLRGYHPSQALSPQRIQARFLRALGVRGEDVPTDADELTALYRSTLDGRRMLMVLDNVNSADQVRPLLPGTAGCLVVITSRDVLLSLIATDGAHRINLDLFSLTEARELLGRRLGRDRLTVDPRAADDIIAASARLPLALAIAAARAVIDRHAPLGVLAAQLRDGLDAFGTDSAMTDVRAVFSWSYRTLSTDAARLLRLLGLHPGPQVTAPAAASLVGLPLKRAEALLDELVRAHLVVEPVPGRYALHDLMREYAVELVAADEAETDRDLAVHRALDHYLHSAYAAAVVINAQRVELTLREPPTTVHVENHADSDAAAAWLDAELEVLLVTLDWAASSGFDEQVWQLVRAIAGHLTRRGHWAQWAESYQAALAAAERLGDPIREADAHRGLGRAYTRKLRHEDAHHHYGSALKLYRDAGDRCGQARVEGHLALLHEQQGRHPEAVEHARRSLDLHRKLDDPLGLADAISAVAWCYAQAGRHRLALDHGRQAIIAYQKIGAPDGEAAAQDTVGKALHQLGDFAQAIDGYQAAIRLNRQLGDQYWTAVSLTNLGDTYDAMGDRASAHDAWSQAESIFDELQHPALHEVREKLRAGS